MMETGLVRKMTKSTSTINHPPKNLMIGTHTGPTQTRITKYKV